MNTSDGRMREREYDTPGLPPAGAAAPHGGTERTEFFGALRVPMQNGTGDPAKAWPNPKGMPAEMRAKAAEIVADKKARDAEAVANGTARPGQIAGARARR